MSRDGVMTSQVRQSTKYFINLELYKYCLQVTLVIEIISYTFSDF